MLRAKERRVMEGKKKQNKSRWHASEGLCSRAKYLISWGLGHFKAFGC